MPSQLLPRLSFDPSVGTPEGPGSNSRPAACGRGPSLTLSLPRSLSREERDGGCEPLLVLLLPLLQIPSSGRDSCSHNASPSGRLGSFTLRMTCRDAGLGL
ncbi:hypothetical protein Vretimale_10175 [Volvox reticuliferus]|uniref:Uncharacterized protein n=1 Tax=Volvox reticuliferus TaxID=1737510 RepID=A0A8J4GEX1_9CHLO|nr:hypothetical protein Vretifemale_598 [Volvox reticuliferus]GIM05733.1 hypothetical protein Vretimale_10175 [Volvox reticuliferus]